MEREIQALDRTQPDVPLRKRGRDDTVTFEGGFFNPDSREQWQRLATSLRTILKAQPRDVRDPDIMRSKAAVSGYARAGTSDRDSSRGGG